MIRFPLSKHFKRTLDPSDPESCELKIIKEDNCHRWQPKPYRIYYHINKYK
ncbi:hypothetical protein ISN45_At03g004850 [Arabidopsis thaliana x Arabidopsis arenosa]|uniref:Uncharacterized protein n=1 Tax=Arabidopsis thaliana x Arabidopsis arenosa TaxID=1240361 RepID=A0A8T2ELT1_9BRAS|nr:hypothetical protein ISN45_At03g004850 [Arabidopsis thaliana x Arabidopsis arenosa]